MTSFKSRFLVSFGMAGEDARRSTVVRQPLHSPETMMMAIA